MPAGASCQAGISAGDGRSDMAGAGDYDAGSMLAGNGHRSNVTQTDVSRPVGVFANTGYASA